jgi:(S)-2-hydroxyglutarate dehydrogenase
MSDLLVIGAGVVGLCTALAWARKYPSHTVTVLDKELDLAQHASGRNSGVLHAGFYYDPSSLKARFCRDGNARMREFCADASVPINLCGKLVVAQSADEAHQVDGLHARGVENGVDLEVVDELGAKEIEPRVHTVDRALWSPTTAAVDPKQVMAELRRQAQAAGVRVRLGEAAIARDGDGVLSTSQRYTAGRILNAAGLHADRIAAWWGVGDGLFMLPFKGLYAYATPDVRLNCHIYPVPEPGMPFLGVHFTLTATGQVKVGPTALPALAREHYGGLKGLGMRDAMEAALGNLGLMATDAGFRALAVREAPKVVRSELVKRALPLADLSADAFTSWGRPGIRAQLYDSKARKLVMDFRVDRGRRSVHVLNAVSPGFTCAFPFADYLVEQLESVPS